MSEILASIKREINQFRTALWCRYVFFELDIDGPNSLGVSSLRSTMKGEDGPEALVSKIESSLGSKKAKKVCREVFLESDVKWKRYANGSHGIQGNYVLNQLDIIVQGSRSFFEVGPFYLFEMLLSKSVTDGWDSLRKAFCAYADSLYENRYKKFFSGEDVALSDNYFIERDFTSEIDTLLLEKFFNGGWEKQYPRLDTILPDISDDAYFHVKDPHNLMVVSLNLVVMCFIAMYSTEPNRYSDLGKLLFSELHCGLIFQMEEHYRVPKDIWFKVELFRKAARATTKSPNLLPDNIQFIDEVLKQS